MSDLVVVDLKDAVAVYRTKDGRLHVDSSVQPTSTEQAEWGGFLGAILGGLLAAPFTAGGLEQFRGYGGTILRTTLPPREASRLQQVIGVEGATAAPSAAQQRANA